MSPETLCPTVSIALTKHHDHKHWEGKGLSYSFQLTPITERSQGRSSRQELKQRLQRKICLLLAGLLPSGGVNCELPLSFLRFFWSQCFISAVESN